MSTGTRMAPGNAAPIRVLVVDDEQAVLDAFRLVFEPFPGDAGSLLYRYTLRWEDDPCGQ